LATTQIAQTQQARVVRTPWLWLVMRVFAPFAAAYFLSYLLRNINAVIAPSLSAEFMLDAGQLGTLTASYFLGFALMQIPIGLCLDRFSPAVVQAVLYIVAAGGTALFGLAHSPASLLAGRFLVGVGVAGGLVAGLKSIAHWFPKDRVPAINGAFIAIGTLGAVAATAPSEWALATGDWRTMFLALAIVLSAMAFVFTVWVPRVEFPQPLPAAKTRGYREVLRDPRLWRLAPISGASIGSAWALQGLWAGPWLADVAGLDRPHVVTRLLVMALTLSLGALALGEILRFLRRRNIDPGVVLSALVMLFMASELSLAMHEPDFCIVPWCLIALMGAGTVVTYSITAMMFDTSVLGRVNGIINLFHIGGAFLMQSGVGLLLAQWPQVAPGHYPAQAYRAALLALLAIQLAAFLWYVRARSGFYRAARQ
jgi:MFS family permease